MHVGSVHCGVAPGCPTRSLPDVRAVRCQTNVNFPSGRMLNLGMAFETEIRIALDEHLAIYRAMGDMADCAAFAQRLMLEDERPRLFAVALRAILI
jgi:hypothetical protein